jgi:hypothetical protein
MTSSTRSDHRRGAVLGCCAIIQPASAISKRAVSTNVGSQRLARRFVMVGSHHHAIMLLNGTWATQMSSLFWEKMT